MKVQVLIRLKGGVLDVQGKAVEHSIAHLGFEGVKHVRIGKLVEFEVDSPNFADAKTQVTKICDQFLVNAIIESYEIREA